MLFAKRVQKTRKDTVQCKRTLTRILLSVVFLISSAARSFIIELSSGDVLVGVFVPDKLSSP